MSPHKRRRVGLDAPPGGDLLTLREEPERGPALWGYARVSTKDQDATAQTSALVAAGVARDRIVVETASGARASRPKLSALLNLMQSGDTLVVWKLDRLGRSMVHLVRTIDDLGKRGIDFRSLTDPIDTTTAQGRLVFSIMASFAEFELALIKERTAAGLARARAADKQLGRPSTIKPLQHRTILAMAEDGASHSVIAESTGLSKAQVGRVLRGEIASLAHLRGAPSAEGELPLYGRPTR